MKVPVIDFAQLDHQTTRQALVQACRELGFFALRNHAVNETLQTQFMETTHAYFAQPSRDKLAQERTPDNPYGFYDKELTKNRLDHKEIFDICLSATPPTLWPENDAFKHVTSSWYVACHKLALALTRTIFDCLKLRFEEGYFANHSSFLRLNYYPRIDVEPVAQDDHPLGISHHTDAGALTLLLQDGIESLQFERNGQWHTVPADSDQLLVNLGDMMQVWSNDSFKAPSHRVLTSKTSDRFSAPYFLNPANDCEIKPLTNDQPRYRPIAWQEFRSGRAAGDYADHGEEIQISDYRLAGS